MKTAKIQPNSVVLNGVCQTFSSVVISLLPCLLSEEFCRRSVFMSTTKSSRVFLASLSSYHLHLTKLWTPDACLLSVNPSQEKKRFCVTWFLFFAWQFPPPPKVLNVQTSKVVRLELQFKTIVFCMWSWCGWVFSLFCVLKISRKMKVFNCFGNLCPWMGNHALVWILLLLWSDNESVCFQCLDGVNRNGSCVCNAGFAGAGCEFWANSTMYGPQCNNSESRMLFTACVLFPSDDFSAEQRCR